MRRLLQVSLSGCAMFSGRVGRSGTVQFAPTVGAAGSEWQRLDWEQLILKDEAVQEAAEVVIGRAELRDLTGLGMTTSKAERVRAVIPQPLLPLPDLAQCELP